MEPKIVKREGRNKILSGYCSNGHCEGTRPVNYRDRPLPTCPLYLECPCICHKQLDDMYEQAGIARILLSNPDYAPDKHTFVMPDYEELARERAERMAAEGRVVVSEAGEEDILAGKVFTKTESGIRAKGQLEYQVFIACSKLCWPSSMCEIMPITPKVIAEYISRHEGIEPPSSGAILAAWQRWEKMQFANYLHSPVRFAGFVGFEDERPTVRDLERTKDEHKRKTRLVQKEQSRNLIRGSRD